MKIITQFSSTNSELNLFRNILYDIVGKFHKNKGLLSWIVASSKICPLFYKSDHHYPRKSYLVYF